MQHKKTGITFAAFGGKHSAGTKDTRLGDELTTGIELGNVVLGNFVQARVGDDLSFATQSNVCGSKINAVFVEVTNTLFEHKDRETGFEDLVEFGGREFGKGFDLQGYPTRERRLVGCLELLGRILEQELLPNFGVGILANGEELTDNMFAVEILHLLREQLDLDGIRHHRIEDSGDFAVLDAVGFLRFGRSPLVMIHVILMLRAVACAVHQVALFVGFTADFRAVNSAYFCHGFKVKCIYILCIYIVYVYNCKNMRFILWISCGYVVVILW